MSFLATCPVVIYILYVITCDDDELYRLVIGRLITKQDHARVIMNSIHTDLTDQPCKRGDMQYMCKADATINWHSSNSLEAHFIERVGSSLTDGAA